MLLWLSQAEFAQRVGVSRRQVAYWEAGSDAPSAERMVRIGKVLHVSTDWLLSGAGWLRDVNDLGLYAQRRNAHFARTASIAGKILLFNRLPFDFNNVRTQQIDAIPDDRHAVAFAVPAGFEPTYAKGETLLLHPLNIKLEPATQRGPAAKVLAGLHLKHAALVVNGDGLLAEIRCPSGRKLQFQPLQTRGGRTSRIRTVSKTDQVTIQAAVYKRICAV